MSNFSHLPLQQAIYERLTGDSTLMGIVTGIFDRVPQGTAFPYVTIGEATGSDCSTKTTTGMEFTVIIHAWSREGGRAETASIMEQLHRLLHQAPLTPAGQTLVFIRFTGSQIAVESDGGTYHGIMSFHAVLQAN